MPPGFFEDTGKWFENVGEKIKGVFEEDVKPAAESTYSFIKTDIFPVVKEAEAKVESAATTVYTDAKDIVNKQIDIFGQAAKNAGDAAKNITSAFEFPFLWIAVAISAILILKQ